MGSPLGFVLVLVGLPHAVWPYRIARFEERIDAIGSNRHGETVEPSEWRVTLTRLFGIGMIVAGLVVAFSG